MLVSEGGGSDWESIVSCWQRPWAERGVVKGARVAANRHSS